MNSNKKIRRRDFLKILSSSTIALGVYSEYFTNQLLASEQKANKSISNNNTSVTQSNATTSNVTSANVTSNATSPIYKNFKYSNLIGALKGISAAQMRFHLMYYKRCVDKLKDLEESKDSIDLSSSDFLESPWRNYLLSLLDLRNKVLLHDLYFSSLAPVTSSINPSFKKAIDNCFGSIDQWWIELKATAMAIRAWALLGWDISSQALINIGLDNDSQFPAQLIPILVIDVHEHAYEIDYPGDRLSYLDAIYKNISWTVLNNRFKQIKI